jgi:RimJ/RimL family protein N-acetyltransferase
MPSSAPLDHLAWPRTTARLAIRPATADDVEATWRFRRLPEVSRWITRAPRTLDEYAAQFLDVDSLARTLVVERTGEVVGDLMLKVGDAWAQAEVADAARGVEAELGWALHPDQAGRGYAAEAVTELIRLSFEELGIRRVVAACFAGNERSSRLMERLGLRREATFVRDSLHRSGAWMDSLQYALLADEWAAAHGDVAVPRSR